MEKKQKNTHIQTHAYPSASAALFFLSSRGQYLKHHRKNMTAINKTVLIIPTPIWGPSHIYQAFNINID